MDILPHIAGKLPKKIDEQKAACMAALEPVVDWLTKRGALPGVLVASLAELSIKVRQDASDREAFHAGKVPDAD